MPKIVFATALPVGMESLLEVVDIECEGKITPSEVQEMLNQTLPPGIEIVGAEAQLWGDHSHRTLCRVRGRDIEDLGPVPAANTVPLVLRSFVDCLREGRPPAIGVADGLAAVETVEAALVSAREGRPVGLEEIRAAA